MEACSQEREENLQRPLGRGTARKPVCLGPVRESRTEEVLGLLVIYCYNCGSCSSDRTSLEGVVKRAFVDLV